MIFLRKFYEAQPTEAGATETATVDKTETAPPVATSAAEALAKFGRKISEGEEPALEPIQISEKKEETKTTETPAPAATAKEDAKVEKVETNEPPTSTEKKEPETTTQTEPVVSKEPPVSWQEVLKQQPKAEILKALGIDGEVTSLTDELADFKGEELSKAVNLLQAIKEGKGEQYIKELSTDYSKMPSEEVMRHQLRKDYPKATDRQIDALYKREVTEAYNLDSTDEVELEEGKALLDAKADRYRDEFTDTQKKFLLPKASEKSKEVTVDPNAEAQRQLVESVTKQFNEDPYTQSVIANNEVTIGEGDEKFKFPVNGKELAELAVKGDADGSLGFEKIVGTDGKETYKPKSEHQLLVAMVNKYGMKVFDEMAKHYKSLGGKKAIEPIDNAKTAESTASTTTIAPPKTPAEAMARMGVLNSGGN